jgi:hypothetical protein
MSSTPLRTRDPAQSSLKRAEQVSADAVAVIAEWNGFLAELESRKGVVNRVVSTSGARQSKPAGSDSTT